jgi:hypothetical protein
MIPPSTRGMHHGRLAQRRITHVSSDVPHDNQPAEHASLNTILPILIGWHLNRDVAFSFSRDIRSFCTYMGPRLPPPVHIPSTLLRSPRHVQRQSFSDLVCDWVARLVTVTPLTSVDGQTNNDCAFLTLTQHYWKLSALGSHQLTLC